MPLGKESRALTHVPPIEWEERARVFQKGALKQIARIGEELKWRAVQANVMEDIAHKKYKYTIRIVLECETMSMRAVRASTGVQL